jgi:hypothetical protein
MSNMETKPQAASPQLPPAKLVPVAPVAHAEPQLGGSYVRNLDTGELTPAGADRPIQPEQE